MKMIMAMIQPERLENVKKDLADAGIGNMTVLPALGAGSSRGYKEFYGGFLDNINLLHKTMILTAIRDGLVKTTVDVIKRSAWSGKIGDGKIFVINLDNVIRIRTGEEGEEAILP